MSESEPPSNEHTHQAVTHAHEHYHVTHNFFEHTGVFEHLGFRHQHEHAHATDRHSHHPHENYESEHATEAHDHLHPVAPVGRAREAKRPTAAKRAAAAAKLTAAARTAAADVTPPRSPGSGVRAKKAPASNKAAPESSGGRI